MTRALIIDDNVVGIQVLAQFLEVADVSYVALQHSYQIEELSSHLDEFDVIFLDLEMPNPDGFTLFRFLREDMNLSIPIIAYSVHSNEMLTAQQIGFDGFLSKPIRKERFPAQLQRILQREPVWEAD